MMKRTHTLTVISALALSIFLIGSVSANEHMQGDRGGYGENREAVHAAVEANDYSMLSTEAQEKISEEKFNEMVSNHAEKQEHKAALEKVVAANDFEGFLALHGEHKAEMETHRAEMEEKRAAEGKEMKEREEPTDEELRAKFDKMVTYYNENGKLPAIKKMNKKKVKKVAGAVKKARRGGGLSDGQRTKVQKVVDRIEDADRLESILERIVNMMETIEAKDMSDERKDKIIGILETIQEMIEAKLS